MRKPSPQQISNVMRYLRSKGGGAGGHARAAVLTPEQRKEIASKAGSAPRLKVRSDKGKKRKPRPEKTS